MDDFEGLLELEELIDALDELLGRTGVSDDSEDLLELDELLEVVDTLVEVSSLSLSAPLLRERAGASDDLEELLLELDALIGVVDELLSLLASPPSVAT